MGEFQQWYSKVPAVVLKSTSSGTWKYQQWYKAGTPAAELINSLSITNYDLYK